MFLGKSNKIKNVEQKLAKLHALLEEYSLEENDDDSDSEMDLIDFPISSLKQLNDLEERICSSLKAERQLVLVLNYFFFTFKSNYLFLLLDQMFETN